MMVRMRDSRSSSSDCAETRPASRAPGMDAAISRRNSPRERSRACDVIMAVVLRSRDETRAPFSHVRRRRWRIECLRPQEVSMRRTLCLLSLFALMSIPAVLNAQSQATTGVIEGTVSDQTGARVPGATVTLTNTGTNFTREVVTDVDGHFRGLLLPLGTYKLTVALAGFGSYVQEGITLAVGQTANVPVTLSVATLRQEVLVTADAPIVETTRSEKSTLIDSASLSSLPNNGRNFLSFMQLTPGVAIVQGPDGDEISVNGQKGISNNISVDGADFNNPFFGEQRGGQRPAFTFNQDAIQEMVVVADGAAPELSRGGAKFSNVVPKPATSTSSGSFHAFGKADGLSSANSAGEKFEFDQEQF